MCNPALLTDKQEIIGVIDMALLTHLSIPLTIIFAKTDE